jgi:probable HAF family extracellular repeat protein
MSCKVPLTLVLAVGATACDWTGEPDYVTEPTLPLFSTVTEITMEDIGSLSGGPSIPFDQNELGQVVGYSLVGYAYHAFLWEGGDMTDLGALMGASGAYCVNELGQRVVGTSHTPGGPAAILWDNGSLMEIGRMEGFTACYAHAVNDAGRVVGECSAPGPLHRAFVWEGGAMIDLGDLGGSWTELAGDGVSTRYSTTMNESGRVVGWSETADGEHHAFVWDEGVMVDLGTLGGYTSYAAAVNEFGHVTGSAAVSGNYLNPFFWDGTEMTELCEQPTGFPNKGIALNDLDQVVGTCSKGSQSAGFIWERSSGLRPLGDLGGIRTTPLDINNLGQVVGYSETASGESHAFFWDDGTMIDLGKLEGTTFSGAWFINDAGQIIGRSEGRAVLWTVVIRPATPSEETQILIDAVEQLVASGAMDEVAANSLLVKLNVVNTHLNEGRTRAAVALLTVFLMDVERYVAVGWL